MCGDTRFDHKASRGGTQPPQSGDAVTAAQGQRESLPDILEFLSTALFENASSSTITASAKQGGAKLAALLHVTRQ